MVVAFIMGRKGSKGFSDKNLYRVLDKPLAYYPMKAVSDCSCVDRAYLSTDDERLMALARENNIDVIQRPPELCTNEALGEDVYVHSYNFVRDKFKDKEIEFIILLMCNAVMVTPEIISEGIKVLRQYPEYDSAVTVSKYNMWSPLRARKIGSDGLLHPFVPFEVFDDSKNLNCDRDSQGDVWFADMGASIVRPKCLENIEQGLLPQKWMGQKIYPLRQNCGLDVDYEWQIPQVEYWLEKERSV